MTPVFLPRPCLPLEVVRAAVFRSYGLEGDWEPLPGERDQNFRLETDTGERYVIKVSNPADSLDLTRLQNAAIQHLAKHWSVGLVPVPLYTSSGNPECTFESTAGRPQHLRVLRFLEGTPLARVPQLDAALLEKIGRALGSMDRALEGFDHRDPGTSLPWNLRRGTWVGAEIGRIVDPARRALVEHWLLQFRARVEPHLDKLPVSWIHGDANDENILVRRDGEDGWDIAGLLDFGDMVRNPTVNELAIAGAYVLFDADDPLVKVTALAAGYHDNRPLSELEMKVLLPLIGLRLSVSVTMSAIAAEEEPGNEHRQISSENAWAALDRLAAVDWRVAESRVRQACGLPPRPASSLEAGDPRLDDLAERRQRNIAPSLRLSYEAARTFVRGRGAFLFSPGGEAYLDCVNNICHVGHSHPKVVEALSRQAAILNTNTRYLHPLLVEFAERLTATFPPGLEVCYFVNSGSEANELAVRLARTHTRRQDVLVVDGAYHGNTSTLVDLSPYKCEGPGGAGLAPWAHKVTTPDPYRGPHRAGEGDPGLAYAREVQEACERLAAQGKPPALFLCESILGCCGQVALPDNYLREAFESVRAAGGVCAVDEVQVGLGRVGSHWWAFEAQDVVPDIVTLGKPIGNGHPLGAVVTTRAIADSFANGMEYFNSFGGNPVSMAVGLAVLDVIEKEGLRERAARVGGYLSRSLQALAETHHVIGDIRGAGMFLGVELVRDRDTLEPATEEAARIVEQVLADHILLSAEGPHHNILKIKPPLAFQEPEADLLIASLSRALSQSCA